MGFGLGPTVTRTKQTAVQLSLGLTKWVKLSLGLNVGELNVKAPSFGGVSVGWPQDLLCWLPVYERAKMRLVYTLIVGLTDFL